ncbi:MAG TPA: cell division protein FtsZ [Rhodospirillaceae bacterium]|nr:cell division protein FtsZ [Rhodospirillaceae bacterium]
MINFHPDRSGELKPRITVIGVGGAGGNAVNNMISSHLEGVEFIVANTDAQAMSQSRTDRRIQLGTAVTQGLGAGARPDVGRASAEEALDEIVRQLQGSNMVFITAGMGGGTGTGAAPVIARAAREHGILTVGVVTKPFNFEGAHRMRLADAGIEELTQFVDTLIIIPNQNLFRVASEKTTFADAFRMADNVLYSGVRGVTDLMIMPGLINLDFADIRTVMSEMGKAMMGTGEAEGDKRAQDAAEAAISNPLLEDISMKGARGVLINITGGMDLTLFEVDEAANRIREEVDADANIIVGSTFDEKLEGKMRVSVVATGIDVVAQQQPRPTLISLAKESPRPAVNLQPFGPRPAAAAAAAAATVSAMADRNIGGGHGFNGSAALAHQPMEEQAPETASALEVGMSEAEPESDPVDFRAEPDAAAPREVPTVVRVEPSLAPPRRDVPPAQGSLRIDPSMRPEPRHETRGGHKVEPQLNLRGGGLGHPAPAEEDQPATRPIASQEEPPRRSRFLDRLTGFRQPAAAPPRQAAEPSYAPPQTTTQNTAAPSQPTARVSPTERTNAPRSDEDLLDIPAFLRRQAN